MKEATPAIDDAFEAIAPDEVVEIRALERAIQLSDGFSLIFARCNQPAQRHQLVFQIEHDLPSFAIQKIDFKEPVRHLLDELRLRIQDPVPDAVFVSGLEYSLPVAANADRTPTVANLNAARNSFAIHVPCPLVLWIPDYVLTAIMRGAPDFFSVRSGAFFFTVNPVEFEYLTDDVTSENYAQTNNLTLSEKLERITSIEELIAEYRLLPPDATSRASRRRLLHRLGDLYKGIGRLFEAEKAYYESMAIAQEMGFIDEEIKDLYGLGIVYAEQRRLNDAEAAFDRSLDVSRSSGNRLAEAASLKNLGSLYILQGRLSEAGTAFQRALEINRDENGANSESIDLMNLAILSGLQGQSAKAEQYYRQSLAVSRKATDRVNEGIALGNLGGLLADQKRFEEAQLAYEESLTISIELGDFLHSAGTMLNMGKLYADQGRLAEMEQVLTESLRLYIELGDRVHEGQCLHNLAILYRSQGEIERALDCLANAISAFEGAQYLEGIEDTRRLLAHWQQES